MKTLSIVVTTYNHEKYIKECLTSILQQQELPDFEIIIGDDCSTDNTPQIINEFKQAYPDIIKILPRPKNLGMQKNLQDCFRHCTGEFIAICEGDDYWLDNFKCRKMIDAFQHHPSAVFCFTNIVLLKDNKFEDHASKYKDKLTEIVTVHDVLFPINLVANFSCCMYRKKILQIVPDTFFQSDNADWLFNLYALDYNYGIYIKDVCSVYRLQEASLYSSLTLSEQAINLLTICWKYNKLFANKYENEFLNFAKNRVIKCVNSLEKQNTSLSEQLKQNDTSFQKQIENIAASVSLTEKKQTTIINDLEYLKNMNTYIISEIKKNFFTKVFSVFFHKKVKIKNNKKIFRYYFLGISIFKITQKVVDYNHFLGSINYKYIHILHKTIITADIVRILNKYFSSAEHAFIFNSGAKESIAGKLFAPNIFYGNINTLKIDLSNIKKIIIYGMFSPRLVQYLYNNRKLLPQTYWAIMGGDLYSAPNDEVNNFVRQNLKAIITTFDKDEYIKRFGAKKSFDIVYNNPLTKYIRQPVPHKISAPYKIMVNNSTDLTTLEMLDILSKFKDENIIVITNVSYETYGQQNVKQQILKKGKEIFGKKFKPVLKWQSPQQYVKFLSSIDIYISNQNRQQGVGNMSALMLLGKKVFIKSDISSYSGFINLGIKVFDTNKIKKLSFEKFVHLSQRDTEKNIAVLTKRLSLDYQIKLWEKVIND